MAPGHSSGEDAESAKQYQMAWRATMQAIKSGDSQSGYERNMAFLNRPAAELPGGRGFSDVSAVSGLDFADDARGLALVDWDRDGDLDLWLRNRSAPSLRLMINRLPAEENEKRFVAFRLQGTSANRDAIGARVEVTFEDGSSQLRSLAAGSGFLSQSSKWLHFGLAEDAVIKEVVVQWPWGERESFEGVSPGKWWHLLEGNALAQDADLKPQIEALAATPQADRPLASGRTLFPIGIPAPSMSYRTSEGESLELGASDGKRLILFWSSWCPHCQAELGAFAETAVKLRAAGIDVLAINVDQVIEGPSTSETEIRELIEQSGFPFSWGFDEGLALQKLKHLEHVLLDRDTELSVPYSCLLDERGEVNVFYRGPVKLAEILKDVALLSKNSDSRRAAISGFGGRTFSEVNLRGGLVNDIGKQFQNRFPLEAIRYLKMALPSGPYDRENHPVSRRIGGLYYVLGLDTLKKGEAEIAVSHFENCIDFRPTLLDARLNLSVALFRTGKAAEAKGVLEELLKIDPSHAGAQANLRVISKKLQEKR